MGLSKKQLFAIYLIVLIAFDSLFGFLFLKYGGITQTAFNHYWLVVFFVILNTPIPFKFFMSAFIDNPTPRRKPL